MFSIIAVQIDTNLPTNKQTFYTRERQSRECLPKTMNKSNKLKGTNGRINRLLRIPVEVHQAIKIAAKERSLTVSEMYDQIIGKFLIDAKNPEKNLHYLYHHGSAKKTSIYLLEQTLDEVKSLAERDDTPENRIIFTAIMRFVDDNLLLTV